MTDFAELKKRLIADGELNEAEVLQLREAIFEDGMTMEKGDFLFSLKDAANKKKISPAYKSLFVEAISSLLLEDEESPGEIDESEAKWLRAKIQNNSHVDEYDRALLKNLRERSINFPSILNYKNLVTRKFEHGRVSYTLFDAFSCFWVFVVSFCSIYKGFNHCHRRSNSVY